MKNHEDFFKKLKEKGIRLTRSRKALLSFFAHADSPRAIPNIQQVFQKEGLAFHKTTLYRELAFLVNEGIVKEVIVSGEKRYYELAGRHHHHAVCFQCGSIRDISFPEDLKKIEENLSKRDGFRVIEHSLEFFGICYACTL